MSPTHRAAIARGQRRAWLTRQRVAIGTTRIGANGYVMVKVAGKGRWRAQHVLVIEAEIGRLLLPSEHVHHINAIKTDNRRENLHLFSGNAAHQAAHRSIETLLADLIESSAVRFDRHTGRYVLSAPRPGRHSVAGAARAPRRRGGRIGAPWAPELPVPLAAPGP